jgi:phosphatidylglycerophosphatase A
MKQAAPRKIFTHNKLPIGFLRQPINWLAIGFGSGLSPFMPGTIGTIVAIPIFILLNKLSLPLYSIILTLLILLGFWICGFTERKLNINDPAIVVWDEIVGYLLTMITIPATWLMIILGFILFRIFDIWKPWPISWANKNLHGGFGIVIDDLMAGICAWFILKIVIIICG